VKTKKKVYHTLWSELLKYVFKHEVSNCDHCGTQHTLVPTITSQNVCQKILSHLGRPVNEAIVRSPRAPPEDDYSLLGFKIFLAKTRSGNGAKNVEQEKSGVEDTMGRNA
jgi:hypothetical protein